MKRILLTAVVSFALTGAVVAETKAPAKGAAVEQKEEKEGRSERRIKALTTELKLNKTQQAEIKTLMDAHRDRLKEIQRETAEKRRVAREEMDTKVLAVLKGDQKTKYEKLRSDPAEMRRVMRDMRDAEDDGK